MLGKIFLRSAGRTVDHEGDGGYHGDDNGCFFCCPTGWICSDLLSRVQICRSVAGLARFRSWSLQLPVTSIASHKASCRLQLTLRHHCRLDTSPKVLPLAAGRRAHRLSVEKRSQRFITIVANWSLILFLLTQRIPIPQPPFWFLGGAMAFWVPGVLDVPELGSIPN